MNTSKLINGIAAFGLMFAAGSAHAGSSKCAAPPAKVTRPAKVASTMRRASIVAKSEEIALDVRTKNAEYQAVEYKSELIENTPALHVLRELDVVVLRELVRIPQRAIATCGNVCAPEHRIAGKIPDTGKREALRNWVKAGGEWEKAVYEVIHEKAGE